MADADHSTISSFPLFVHFAGPTQALLELSSAKIEEAAQVTRNADSVVRIDARSGQIPTQLPAPGPGGHLLTYIPLEVKFIEKGAIEVAIEGDAASRLELPGIPELDRQKLAVFCRTIRNKIESTIRWVATGEGNPERRMGFHV